VVVAAAFQWLKIPKEELSALAGALRRRLRRESFDMAEQSALRGLLQAWWPLVLSVSVRECYVYIDYLFASALGEGSLSLLSYADRLWRMFLGVMIVPGFLVLLPRWTQLISKRDEELKSRLLVDINLLIVLTAPLAAFLLVCGGDLAVLFYGEKSFTSEQVYLMRLTTVAYSGSLLIAAMSMCFERLLVSVGNTIAIGKINLALLLLNAVLDFVFTKFLALPGIALATTVVFAAQLFLFFKAISEHDWFPRAEFLICFRKLAQAFVIVLLLLFILSSNYQAGIITLSVWLVISFVSMLCLTFLFRLPCSGALLSIAATVIRR
ncbi:hypothetical protein BVY02_00200, partial [bacterium J17]